MKDPNDRQTVDAFGYKPKRKPGPKPSGKAKTPAQRQKEYRERIKARIAEMERWELEMEQVRLHSRYPTLHEY